MNIEFWPEYPLILRNKCSFKFITQDYACKFKFSTELFKNTFMADCGQLRAETQRNVFCNTSEHLFRTL